MKVKCQIVRTVFSKDNYRVFGCVLTEQNEEVKLTQYGNFKIAGEYPYIEQGREYELELRETTGKYGAQYIVVDIPSLRYDEITDENELQYLEQITTPSQARNINKVYPDFIRIVLRGEEDTIDVNKIYNVGDYRLQVYIREIQTKFKFFALIAAFPQYRLSIEDAKELSRQFPSLEELKEYIVEHPYSALIEILKRGFESSDKLILEINPEFRESFERCEFMLLWLLGRNEMDGNTRIYANALAGHIKEYDSSLLKMVKDVAIQSNRIYFDNDSKDMAKMDTYVAECNIADFVKFKLKESTKLNLEHGYEKFIEVDGFKLTEKQQGLPRNFIDYDFSILLGYSGSGKSSSVVALIRMLEANRMTYTCLAPSGKAAKRLSQCIGRKASTIHKAIAGDGFISTDVVIIDEFSMVDVLLCSSLFNKLSHNTRVVIVGDNCQLSSIGCGNVFTDMINSNIIPITMLDEVFRYNEGGMMMVATDLRNGVPYFDKLDKNGQSGNFRFIQADNETAFDILKQEYEKALKKYKPHEIMVLSPFNVGDCGTYNINSVIQAEVKPPKAKEYTMSRKIGGTEIIFRKGDFVLNCTNDYKALTLEEYERLEKLNSSVDLELDLEDEEIEGISLEPNYVTVYNGDTGIIRSIDEKKMVVEIDEQMIVYEKSKIGQLLLSYSISTHKSQGSQAEYVINLSLPMHKKMLTSNLLYVADTRSSKTMVEIGDEATIRAAIRIKDENERYTFLCDLLKN